MRSNPNLDPRIAFTTVAAFASCAACYFSAGASLDFFIGCVLFASLICPILSTASTNMRGTWAVASVIWLVNIGWWLVVGRMVGITVVPWMSISLILAGTLGVMTAATRLLIRCRITPVLAAAMVTILQILWLTWPIWLSPSLAGAKLNWSASLHPLLAMNGVLKELGIWTEQPIAYNLTTLGQDVQYRLPVSAWPVIAAQAAVTIVMVMMGRRTSVGR